MAKLGLPCGNSVKLRTENTKLDWAADHPRADSGPAIGDSALADVMRLVLMRYRKGLTGHVSSVQKDLLVFPDF